MPWPIKVFSLLVLGEKNEEKKVPLALGRGQKIGQVVKCYQQRNCIYLWGISVFHIHKGSKDFSDINVQMTFETLLKIEKNGPFGKRAHQTSGTNRLAILICNASYTSLIETNRS